MPDFVPTFCHFGPFHSYSNIIIVRVDVTHGGVLLACPASFISVKSISSQAANKLSPFRFGG
jgi:hypothetical protein